MPSAQAQRYLEERAAGGSVDDARFVSGFSAEEAALWEADIESGEIELPRARARTREDQSQKKEKTEMVNGTVAGDELRLLIERIERLTEEIKALNEDKSNVFKEAKDRGFDTATMKRVIKLRKMEDHTRDEAEALLAVYLAALGMTPIEHAIAMAA